ncbi:MAG: sensor histidine kinase, partial [Dehalococcoidales bacterium]|nr:sensor histidine kinase [Dehalococcoidales bacterium]
DDLGIVPSIRRLLADFSERTGNDGHLDVSGKERRLNRDTELGLFRIAQEALRNVEYHSKATGVALTITFADREAGLQVTDNGIGFEGATTARGKLGILGMRERAELLGGKLDVYSGPDKGATILASIPVPPTD